jgi:hypothetical protein
MIRFTLLIGLLAFTTLEGTEVRTARFRDVLWSVAHKAGYSPESGNFISNQAIPIGEYINDWVSRLYTQEDWPEWTKVIQVAPDANHIVPYETTAAGVFSATPYKIGRVITVYLIDPKTTRAPITTRYSLREDGIHCGYEHGTNVWIKYLEPPPTFTAVPWRSELTYAKNEPVYSPFTGECYKSLVNNNRNHNPSANLSPPPDLTIEETQELDRAEPGIAAQTQIVECHVAPAFVGANGQPVIPDPIPLNYSFTLEIDDTSGTPLGAHSQVQGGTTSTVDLLAALKVMFDADSLPGFTFTVIGPNKFRIESTTTEFVVKLWRYFPDTVEPWMTLRYVQVQPFAAEVSGTDGAPQQLKITVGENAFIPGAIYSATITELDGTEHTVEYASNTYDTRNQILNGILLAIGTSTDQVVNTIGTALNTTEPSATLSLTRTLGVMVQVRPPASQFWQLVPFPEALFNPVVRGAGATLMGEWDQTDKQSVEEGKVGAETGASRGDFEPTQTAVLTTQQQARSRYKY